MNTIWIPPVAHEDLVAISDLLRDTPPVISALPDFGNGRWENFFNEHVIHGTKFYAHLDANFLSSLLYAFSSRSLSKQSRQAFAFLCIAVTFDMKVNPTFSTHEYAFTGQDNPDSRLAGFYLLNNLDPQTLADIALGREFPSLPQLAQLPPTIFNNTHRQYLKTRGLTYASLLKIVDLHRCDSELSSRDNLDTRFARAKALLDWMYYDFLFCGTPLFVADHLWGKQRSKSILKGIDKCNRTNVLSICQNASWDLVLAESWAGYESSRSPGDPIHLVLTFDKALRSLASELLTLPNQQHLSHEEQVLRKHMRNWPKQMAEKLTQKYLSYEEKLGSSDRNWNSDPPNRDEFISSLEKYVCCCLEG